MLFFFLMFGWLMFLCIVGWLENCLLLVLFFGNEILNNCLGVIDLNIDRIWLNRGINRKVFFKVYRINLLSYKIKIMIDFDL